MAFYEVLCLMNEQADAFRRPRSDLGIDFEALISP